MNKMKHSPGIRQKKSLGQVFLKVDWPGNRVVDELKKLGVVRVLEIGPGAGILTRTLVSGGFAITAVEKDSRFAGQLQENTAVARALCPQAKLDIVDADALHFDWLAWLDEKPAAASIVGNIPYHISTPLLMRGIECLRARQDDGGLGRARALLFMTQKEFAARVVAAPGTKDYGSLSVYAQLRTCPELLFSVPRGCFQPVPKVDSAVLLLTPRLDILPSHVLDLVEKVTRTAFMQRRKQLQNSLRQFIDNVAGDPPPLDLQRRADSLSPAEFVQLTKWLFKIAD